VIVATIDDDYAPVRELLAEPLATASELKIRQAVEETVKAVEVVARCAGRRRQGARRRARDSRAANEDTDALRDRVVQRRSGFRWMVVVGVLVAIALLFKPVQWLFNELTSAFDSTEIAIELPSPPPPSTIGPPAEIRGAPATTGHQRPGRVPGTVLGSTEPHQTGGNVPSDNEQNNRLENIRQAVSQLSIEIQELRSIIENQKKQTPNETSSDWPLWKILAFVTLGMGILVSLVLFGSRALLGRIYDSSQTDEPELSPTVPQGQSQVNTRQIDETTRELSRLITSLREVEGQLRGLIESLKQSGHETISIFKTVRDAASSNREARTNQQEVISNSNVALQGTFEDRYKSSQIPIDPQIELSNRSAEILADFAGVASSDQRTSTFVKKWAPKSVVMLNFDQRVRESGFSPVLKIHSDPVGVGSDHFWFVQLRSSKHGYILPSKRSLQHRAAWQGEGGPKFFRMIFEITHADKFDVRRPAHAVLEEQQVRITQQGLIELPS
jgi:hypothetical protein